MVIVGGIGGVHDALFAAALRARGIDARPLGALDRTALDIGREHLPRGYPVTMYFLTGALVRDVAALRVGTPQRDLTFLTMGGHCGHFGTDYRNALRAAGLGDVRVVAPPLATLAPSLDVELGRGVDVAGALAAASILGDVLTRAACVLGAGEVHRLAAATRALESALAEGHETYAHLASVRAALRHATPVRDALRVHVTGEFLASCAPGDVAYGLVDRLARRGAIVRPAALTEWLLYALWCIDPDEGGRTAALRASVTERFRDAARAAGVSPDLFEPAALAALADPHYPAALRGSSGHLEVGTYLAVARDHLADLVVSVKAFASTPSSAVSDAVVHALARRHRTGFVALEVHGADAELQFDSRLALALDLARARAAARSADSSMINVGER